MSLAGTDPFHYPTTGVRGRLARMRRIVWFRFVGTRRARAYLAARPDAVSICHSEALAGDVFVDHGSMLRALRAAGRPLWRILLNPIQPLTYLHERARYRGRHASRHRHSHVRRPRRPHRACTGESGRPW